MGSGIGGILSYEHNYDVFLSRGPRRVSPFLVPMLCSNLVPGNVAIRHGLKGPNFTHVSACATGTTAIGEAFRCIKHGYADILLAGGAEAAITGLTISGFARMRALSTSNDRGAAASRPFDRKRDGFVIAEGAAALVLESLESAQRRGVEILGEVLGYGATCDAFHQTAPAEGGAGIVRAMQLAFEEGKAQPQQVGYVNAHGTSTPFNDKHETTAIRTVFQSHADQLLVSSTKSMSGHMLGASGAMEAVACIKGLQEGRVPPTINLEEPDPDCDLNYVPSESQALDHNHVISNSMGFGGQNASLLLKRWDA
jgi:3-oxoacyl-[acyl-carrier-protein] synthase II